MTLIDSAAAFDKRCDELRDGLKDLFHLSHITTFSERLLYSFSNVCRDFTICFPQNILDQGDIQMRDLKFLFAFGFHVILTCSLWAV